MNREEAIKFWSVRSQCLHKWIDENVEEASAFLDYIEALDMAIKALNDWTDYSDKLWKIAYERGKAEAQTEPSDLAKTLQTPCENIAKDCETDLISRQALIKALDSWDLYDEWGNTTMLKDIIDNQPSVSVYTDTSDLISRADAIEAVKSTKPIVRSTERNWGKMIAEQHSKELVQALKGLPSVSVYTDTSDLISRAEVLGYIERVTNSGLGKNKSLDYIRKYVERADSVSADRPITTGCIADNIEVPPYTTTSAVSAERVNCDKCIYKTMWQEQEKAETLDRHTLDVLQERFEAEELKAHAKSSGLKEHATWNKAIRILEEYMEEGDNDND